ncbi:MAG: DNA mismatch repair endonuclease MutL [Clostridia bacterium]|nr:DNA mismatch repair endonuclease MutL [Clostridia bacterium]
MAINLLDSMIINRISAGEVVESPFSIVKELIDNSIDAKATKITIEIRNGGIDYICVKDNGKGIDYDDIKKAFLPHATSKIKDITDLEAISTLGFRGEALASISNVSQTHLITKTQNSDCAYQINVDGGTFGEIEATISETGTKIEVYNLFYNTPARRKFLRKPKLEESQITNVITRYVLANPTISFNYIVDEKTVYQNNGKNLLDAINCVYGIETTQNLVYIEKEIDNIKLSGYVSKIGFSKANTTYQTLILNNRYIIDEIVSKACYMAFEEYLMPRQFPMYIFNLTMPEIDVDVNVHPSKINVKFANPSKIYDIVYSAVSSAIYNQLNPIKEKKIENEEKSIDDNLIKTDLESLQEIEIEPTMSSSPISTKMTLKQENYSPITIFDLPQNLDKSSEIIEKKAENKTIIPKYEEIETLPDYKIIGEIFNEFIILEKNENMLLLDFHAGHERLNYDKFTKIVENRDIVIQDLLIPYTQELTENEVNFVMELKESLSELGFEIDRFSDKKIIIHSVPMQLKDINLKNFVDDLLHDMKNIKPSMNNEIRHYLMQKACKSSVKSGQTLNEHEIKELLKNLDDKKPVLLCPHGRPILTTITRSQIEKWFKRIV